MNDALGYLIEYNFPLRRDFVATPPKKVELMDKEFLHSKHDLWHSNISNTRFYCSQLFR